MNEDNELVKTFNYGDKSAFDKLLLKYKDRIFNLCYRFLGSYEEANDSSQEVFVKVFYSLKNFRAEAMFSTWLYRIAVNTCKNKLDSSEFRHRKKMMRLDAPADCEDSCRGLEIKDTSSPPLELERKERNFLIQNAIDSLPQEQKAVVVLRDIDGLSYDEIAKVTGHNPGTVKSKLARARQCLREKLTGVL